MTTIHISKLDAAKRELEHAIRLFFLSGDPVVIHVVISSSHNILRDLCENKDIPYFYEQAMKLVKEEKRGLVIKKLREAYNFFHHADIDPDGVVAFNPESSNYVLWDCIEMYSQLANEVTGTMQAYRLWFYTNYSDLLLQPKDQQIFKEIGHKVDLSHKAIFLDLATELEKRRTE